MKKQWLCLPFLTVLLVACSPSPSTMSNSSLSSDASESEENFQSDQVITPFTAEMAFAFLKESQGFTDDILLDHSVFFPEGNYYELKLVSKSLQENGGSGTVGIYQVFEDGTIVDTYAN